MTEGTVRSVLAGAPAVQVGTPHRVRGAEPLHFLPAVAAQQGDRDLLGLPVHDPPHGTCRMPPDQGTHESGAGAVIVGRHEAILPEKAIEPLPACCRTGARCSWGE